MYMSSIWQPLSYKLKKYGNVLKTKVLWSLFQDGLREKKKGNFNFGLAILRYAETENKPALHLHKRVFAFSMVFILDGCSFHVAHVWYINKVFFRKNRIWWLFRCNQMPSTNRNAWFSPCVRIVKWATIYYKNHDANPLLILNHWCRGFYIRWLFKSQCARME